MQLKGPRRLKRATDLKKTHKENPGNIEGRICISDDRSQFSFKFVKIK